MQNGESIMSNFRKIYLSAKLKTNDKEDIERVLDKMPI